MSVKKKNKYLTTGKDLFGRISPPQLRLLITVCTREALCCVPSLASSLSCPQSVGREQWGAYISFWPLLMPGWKCLVVFPVEPNGSFQFSSWRSGFLVKQWRRNIRTVKPHTSSPDKRCISASQGEQKREPGEVQEELSVSLVVNVRRLYG